MIDRNSGNQYIGEMVAFCSGLLFAMGLGIAGMLRPGKVIAFLDIFGEWDYSLAFVMIGAIAVSSLGFNLSHGRDRALNGNSFPMVDTLDVDRRLVIGAVLFGVGWGLSGYCPGPALVSLVSFNLKPFIFVVAMLIGMVVIELLDQRQDNS